MAPPDDPRKNQPFVPPTIRVGMGQVRREAHVEATTSSTLGPGPALSASAPGFDIKSMVVSEFREAEQLVEVRDRKNTCVHLQHQGGASFTVATLVGRQKPQPAPLSLPAGRELSLPLATAVDRVASDPRFSSSIDALRAWVRALAAAAQVELPTGFASTAEQKAFRAAQDKQAFGTGPAWKGFSQQKTVGAPPMKPTTAADVASSGQLERAAPGLSRETMRLAEVNPTRGVLLLADDDGREFTLTQTKFSQPPMFACEFNAPGRPPQRSPVDRGLARELAETVEHLLLRDDHDEQTLKSGALVVRALLKVM